MIISKQKYFSRKEKYKKIKNIIKKQIFILTVFSLLCILVAILLTKNSNITTYTIYYAQNKGANKQTRGIFPPLQGQSQNLYGRWQIVAQIGQTGTQIGKFENYNIIFQKSGRMTISRRQQQCQNKKNSVDYQWETDSYNLFISIIQKQPVNSTTQKDNQTQHGQVSTQNNMTNISNMDQPQINNNIFSKNQTLSQCPTTQTDSLFQNYLKSFTVWTLKQNNIYLISQMMTDQGINVSIFVFANT